MALFDGLDRAYGAYKISGEVSKVGKVQGQAITYKDVVTEELWKNHLEGKSSVGIVPIRDNATVKFAGIDIDTYIDFDLNELEERVKALSLPLLLTRSKSGGAHLWLFLKYEAEAQYIRELLSTWAVALGFPGVEVFPKQDKLAGEHDVGNWINMPYFNEKKSDRYGIVNGKKLSVDKWLKYAENHLIDPNKLVAVETPEPEGLEDAPPCLQIMAAQGIPEGTRNNVLFNFGVYARLRYEDDYHEKIDEYNAQFFDPPLGHQEVVEIAKGVAKKDYFYSCNRDPLSAYCSKSICIQRKYGVGSANSDTFDVTFDSITKYEGEPPTYYAQVNGKRFKCAAVDLLQQSRFAMLCVEAIDYMPRLMKKDAWRKMINELLANAERVEVPEDATPSGQLKYLLGQFIESTEARDKGELLMGKPWMDGENNKIYFRGGDLMEFLRNHKFNEFKQNEIWAVLKNQMPVKHHQLHVQGSCVKCWSIPVPDDMQKESFEVTKAVEDEF